MRQGVQWTSYGMFYILVHEQLQAFIIEKAKTHLGYFSMKPILWKTVSAGKMPLKGGGKANRGRN